MTSPTPLLAQNRLAAAEELCRNASGCKVILKNIPVQYLSSEYVRSTTNEWKAWRRFPDGSQVTVFLLPF